MKILQLSFLLLILFSSSGCFNNDKDTDTASAARDQLLTPIDKPFSAPNSELLGMDGNKHKMSDFRGKPVIVNFWATWCPPCRAELPSMNRAWAKIKDDDILMLAVNMGETEDMILPFTKDYPIDFTILLDKSGQYALDWRIKGLPTTYVVNPEGQVVYQAVGEREWDDDRILDAVRALK